MNPDPIPPRIHRPAFEGIWLPMVTPMRDGQIDIPAARALARMVRDAGIAGLVLFGTTGEGNLLRDSEKIALFEAIRIDQPSLPLVIGVGGIDTRDMAQAVRRLDQLVPTGYLIPPPCYLRPSQEGIVWHYRQIAEATQRPIIVYDIPERTGVAISLHTLAELSRDPQFAAVKECSTVMMGEINRRPDLMPALCGTDAWLLDHFMTGGRGAMPASAHIRPDLFVALCHAARDGNGEEAAELFATIKPLVETLFSEPNPAPVKRALALQGLIADELRPPMLPASASLTRALQPLLQECAEHA
jgi:4-hydroxy-tetrahydrodipicolinate synthase